MRIDEEGMALLHQYVEDFAIVSKGASDKGHSFDKAISDAQIDLTLHLIAVFGVENRIGEKPTNRTPAFKQGKIIYFPERRMYA